MKRYYEMENNDTLRTEPTAADLQPELIKMMLSSIGDEFNRPIGLIYNNCEYLQMHLKEDKANYSPEKMSAAVADISCSVMQLNRLAENFMAMTAIMQDVVCPDVQLVNLVDMLQDLCTDSEEIYRAIGITLQLDIRSKPRSLVVADRTLAERICLNLLSNALQACTEGEHVVFKLEELETGYVLTVTDDGYGFPPEQVLVAFKPFQYRGFKRAKGFERGNGMGLYLCGEYCRLMNWKIGITPKNPGTEVRIEIPRNEKVMSEKVQVNCSIYEAELQHQVTRMEIIRELRTIDGLEGLRR